MLERRRRRRSRGGEEELDSGDGESGGEQHIIHLADNWQGGKRPGSQHHDATQGRTHDLRLSLEPSRAGAGDVKLEYTIIGIIQEQRGGEIRLSAMVRSTSQYTE
jgi:hypothetical protein